MNLDIARELDTLPKTGGLWRNRFAQQRIMGIEKEALDRGRPKQITTKQVAGIVRMTTQETPRTRPSGAGETWRRWRKSALRHHVILPAAPRSDQMRLVEQLLSDKAGAV